MYIMYTIHNYSKYYVYLLGYLRNMVKETEYFGFPCVITHESQFLSGFLTRKDILTTLGQFCIILATTLCTLY